MRVKILSFGFKHGMAEADAVWDVRFLPNPYYDADLRKYPGTEPAVAGFVLDNDRAREFMAAFEPFLLTFVNSHVSAGRESLVLAVGCTGGRHRSVAVACRLRRLLSRLPVEVELKHRDIELD